MRSVLRRSFTATLGLAAALAIALAPNAGAATIHIGPFPVEVPDIEPVLVPIPPGSEAAPLPPLPFPLEWQHPTIAPPPPPPAAETPNPFAGRTVVLDCGHQPQRMPSRIIIFCGDGNGGFRDINWNAWGNEMAHGSATKYWVDCVPTCARGTLRTSPAGISLHDPRQTSAGMTFSRIVLHEGNRQRTTTLSGFQHSGDNLFP